MRVGNTQRTIRPSTDLTERRTHTRVDDEVELAGVRLLGRLVRHHHELVRAELLGQRLLLRGGGDDVHVAAHGGQELHGHVPWCFVCFS